MSKLPKDPKQKAEELKLDSKITAELFGTIIEKAKNLITTGKDHSENQITLNELQTILRPLAEIDDNYPARALDYILSGDDVAIVMDLQNLPNDKANALLGSVGAYSWRSQSNTKISQKQERLATQSKNARTKLYKHLFTALTAEQIVRLGKFYQAVTQEQNYVALSPLTPVWYYYLLIDGLVATLDYYQPTVKERDNWRQFDLFNLLVAEEVVNPEDVLIASMFDRKGFDSYETARPKLAFLLADTVEFLTKHHTYMQYVIPTLSANGQLQFIQDFAKENPDFIRNYPKLIVTLATSTSKTVREQAMQKIGMFKPTEIQTHLQELLTTGDTKQRAMSADLLARGGESSREILQTALANEKQKSVQQAIETALNRLTTLEQTEDEEYTPPPVLPLTYQDIPDSFISVLEQNYHELLEKKKQSAEQEIEENNAKEKGDYRYTYAQNSYKEFAKLNIDKLGQGILDTLNGKKMMRNGHYFEILNFKNRLKALPEFGLIHALRIGSIGREDYLNWYQLENFITPAMFEGMELRQFQQLLTDIGFKNAKRLIGEAYLQSWGGSLQKYIHTPEQIVPFFMQNLDLIGEALGLMPSQSRGYYGFDPSLAIDLLAKFPFIPKQFIAKLLELALGENKRLRIDAQNLLSRLPNIHERAIEALANGKQEIRITAIDWLARMGEGDNREQVQKSAVKPLYDLLKKEKKEVVIASILTALEKLGEEISKYLSPKALLADAEKGLKGKIASSFAWFNLDNLPTVHWKNGKAVDKQIIQWWVVLADKLKDPNPNGLLQRYMDLLDEKSQQALSLHLLQSFITQDTRNPTLDEAMAIANKEAPQRLANYQSWYKSHPQYYGNYANVTLADVVEEIKRERLAIYLGSAIKSKGLLALASQTQGTKAVKILQDFMKHHYRRTSQITALLSAFASSDDPLIIQLLLGVSRRYRTASIQQLAKDLVTQIAERNNWTADELADRTIPTAGLDENGVLVLDFGSRTLTAYVDDKDKFVLKNEDGKVIKALPTARQDDDAELVKEAKAQFSSSKKEYKQVLDLQIARLYEAMCSERAWTVADWQEYLFAHPIMKRLLSRLVWLETDKDGNIVQQFRPSEDGSLLNLDDDEITLQNDNHVKLAHRVLIGKDDSEAWVTHFKDYKVKPLFEQMSHELPEFTANADQIDDRKGYVTDTFTLRGVLNKLGYQRASIEDGGSFDRYYKSFDSVGLSAVIVFSGSYVPEENIPAVVYELAFDKKHAYSWNTNYSLLSDVPPVLLAECYTDYCKLADATQGFDADWQKKTPW